LSWQRFIVYFNDEEIKRHDRRMLMNTTVATHAPVTLTALSWICETLLAQVVAFFDALEAWLPRYLVLMIVAGTIWCGYTSGVYGALLLGLPLGGVMALSYGLVVVMAMFLLGLAIANRPGKSRHRLSLAASLAPLVSAHRQQNCGATADLAGDRRVAGVLGAGIRRLEPLKIGDGERSLFRVKCNERNI
jgi:hypothetical protein